MGARGEAESRAYVCGSGVCAWERGACGIEGGRRESWESGEEMPRVREEHGPQSVQWMPGCTSLRATHAPIVKPPP